MAFVPKKEKCLACGNEYLMRSANHRFCCTECRISYKRNAQGIKQNASLQETVSRARAAGMSYGQYVAMLEMQKQKGKREK